ncbi:hypothetical protein EDD71_10351 [Fonticella tunisiensis]|uniref:Uncharacterized protein n=1 Tax=Fonticella tunisiensis TaxID=1096341 RepID=A0A4R7KSN9_9CLOT|nr:hypothetical protein EDD71_10351 [Fonticella tunisiensis]
MFDLIFIAILLVCFGFMIIFTYWCDKQIDGIQ